MEILDGSERLSHHLMSKALQVSQPGGTGGGGEMFGSWGIPTCYFRGVLGDSCCFKLDAEYRGIIGGCINHCKGMCCMNSGQRPLLGLFGR